ncbi:MAG: DMT family transporter, partial [Nanoarchaeota archaeon]
FGLVFLIAGMPFYKISYVISGKALLGLLYVAVFPTAIAFLLWGKALSKLPAHICSSIALLTPVFSLIIIAIFLKEEIIAAQIIGLSLVIASTAFNIYLSNRKR